MKHYLFLFCGLFFSTFFSLKAQNGSISFSSLNLPSSAHANALGGTNISIIDTDASLATQNPALLGPEMANQIVLSYMNYTDDIKFGNAYYTHSINERGAWAAGVQYIDYGSFRQTTSDNQQIGTFTAKEIVTQGIIGYDINENLRGGVTAKLLYAAYESYTSAALAVDLGLNYYLSEKEASFSLVARNLGGQLKRFDEKRETLPFDLQIGYSQMLAHAPLRISLTAFNLTSWKTQYVDDTPDETNDNSAKKSNFAKDLFRHIIIGIDYLPNDHFYLAAGYNYKKRSDFADAGGTLPGFSAGAGINIRMFDINFSLARLHRSGTTFLLGVNLLLDRL